MLVAGTSGTYLGGRAHAGSPEQQPAATSASDAIGPSPVQVGEQVALTSVANDDAPGYEPLGVPPDDALRDSHPLYGVAFHFLAQVFSEPSERAEVIGYLRRGSTLRAKRGVRGKGCDTEWHALFGGGYACAGRGFLLGDRPQAFPAAAPPMVYEPLPYHYTRAPREAPVYFRPPTPEEEREVAERLVEARALKILPTLAQQQGLPGSGPQPGAKSSAAESQKVLLPEVVRMLLQPGFYVSLDEPVGAAGADFTRTVRGNFVRALSERPVSPSSLQGSTLPRNSHAALALVSSTNATSYARDALSGALVAQGVLRQMEAVELSDEIFVHDGRSYLVLMDGRIVRQDALRVVPAVERPKLVPKRARWIAVSLSSQTLVAYEGNAPVFATLVSTGKAGHETPVGLFRVQSKHISATMDGEAGSDEAYSIEDVPWVMYFDRSIALHAAFWHERFGRARSHGCVNLAPLDARWLFEWTGPSLPMGFHGVLSTRERPGTMIAVVP
jgi:lipoprotein-anchoring transpeptidase ErfK/SrfK